MITEADYGATDQAMNRNSEAGDETLLVRFENEVKTNEFKSKEAGLPIQEMVTFISIISPGQRNEQVYRQVRPKDKLRFPRHWEAFNRRESLPQAEGTALSEWAGVNAAQVEEFKYFHITTVQELVSISDTNEQQAINAELLTRLKMLEENAVAPKQRGRPKKAEKLTEE